MRHAKHSHNMGVQTKEHRKALLQNLAVALIEHGRIRTTLAKAKGLRPFIERLITLAKKAELTDDPAKKLHYRRLAIARLRHTKAAHKLFEERAQMFVNRPGGYTRIYKLMPRIGDAASMALIELIEADDEGYAKRKKKATKAAPKKAAAAKATKTEPKAEKSEKAEDAKADAAPAEEKDA